MGRFFRLALTCTGNSWASGGGMGGDESQGPSQLKAEGIACPEQERAPSQGLVLQCSWRMECRREGRNPEGRDGIQKAELQCQSLPAEGLFPPLCSGLGVSVHRDRAAGGAFQMEITAGHGTAQKITSPTYITALCPNIISLLQSTTEDGEVELVFCLCTFFPFGWEDNTGAVKKPKRPT